ncbi:hypothetical protein GGR01_002914 [Acetobacter oeni]|nr:hypothetical protein [Acetobacter oeni]
MAYQGGHSEAGLSRGEEIEPPEEGVVLVG